MDITFQALKRLVPLFIMLFAAGIASHPALAETAAEGQAGEGETARRLTERPEGRNPLTGGRLLYFPTGDLYPPYAADPFRVGFGFQPVHVTRVDIPNTTSSRVNLRAGGQVGVVRSLSADDPDLGWQVSLIGGFNDQNDVRNSLDNIGWDGHYGIILTAMPIHDLAFKLGLLHTSSHVGDEFMERTGRARISYTRQELAAGVSWFMNERWRVYTETGRAFSMSNRELQRPWRGQAGIEYEAPPAIWSKRLAWYAATDLQATQEREWKVDAAVQTGFVMRAEGRTWRIGVEWYHGRPPMGEFFQFTERYLSIGLWIDI